VPKTKRTSNLPIAQNDSVSPQTYDVLSGHGYVDIKNMELMSKLSQQKSLMGQGSHLLLPMNQDIPQIEMFRSASKEQM